MYGGASGSDSSAPYRYLCVRSWPAVQTTQPAGAVPGSSSVEAAAADGNGGNSDTNSAGPASTTSVGTDKRGHHQHKMMASRVPVKCFNGFQWTTSRNWHHLVLTHEKNDINVFVDGIAIESTWIVPVRLHHKANRIQRITHFPGCEGSAITKSTVSRKHAICGYIARRADEPLEILKEHSQSSRRSQFSGMIGPIHIVEGIWDENYARKIFAQGCMFSGSLAEIQIPGKLMMAVNASSYADLGRAKASRSQSSLSVHFRSGRRSSTDFVDVDGTSDENVLTRGERSGSGYGSILSEGFLSSSFESRERIQWGRYVGGELASTISPARRRISSITEARSAPRRRSKMLGSLEKHQSDNNQNGSEFVSTTMSTSTNPKRLSVTMLTRSPERRSLGGVSRNSSGVLSDPRLGVSRARRSTESDEMDEMSLNAGSLLRRQLVQQQQMAGHNLDLGMDAQQTLTGTTLITHKTTYRRCRCHRCIEARDEVRTSSKSKVRSTYIIRVR